MQSLRSLKSQRNAKIALYIPGAVLILLGIKGFLQGVDKWPPNFLTKEVQFTISGLLALIAGVALSLNVPAVVEFLKATEKETKHETDSETHIDKFQVELDAFQEVPSPLAATASLEDLRKRLEIQLNIEELIVKSRMANHVKFVVYGPIGVPLLVSVIGFLAGYYSR